MTPRDLVDLINPPKYLSVLIGYTVAQSVLRIFETKYPKDLRPRKALEKAKKYLDGESVNASAAYAAADDAYHAADAAVNASAAYAAACAADAAACAADTAAAVDAASAAACAADAAAATHAATASTEEEVNKLIYSLIPEMIAYSREHQTKLFSGPGDFSELFDDLDSETQELLIYNLDLIK